MKTAKRFIGFLLALALVVTCVPLSARAADHVRGTVIAEKTMDEPEVGGQCGDDVYWRLDEEGILTIYGTGMMWDYPEEFPDYVLHQENIKACVIEEGVTSIGVYAFFCCDSMVWVDVPASVVVVNECAFALCESLAVVFFYGDAPDIGSDAFWGVTAECHYSTACDGWDEVAGNDYDGNLTWIPRDENESDDEPDDVPDEDEWIGSGQCGDDVYWSLSEDGLLAISGTGDMWDYSEDDPGWYPYSDQVTACVIEEGVTSIGEFAFYDCPNIEKVTLPGSVSRIGKSAFYSCCLTELTIPSGVKEIGPAAFKSNRMTSVTIPASVEIIDEFAFSTCHNLTEIRFQGGAPEIGDDAFEEVVATCYYPDGSSWSNDMCKHYGGRLTWIAEGGQDESLPGDLDGNGTVDSDDAIYLLYYTLFGDGLYPVSGDCDFNNDGNVDSDDAIYLLYYTLFGDALYPLN